MFNPNNQIKKGPSVNEVRAKATDGKVKTEQVLTFGQNKNQMSVDEARAAMIAAGEAPAGDPREAKGGGSSDQQTRWQRAARPTTATKVDMPTREEVKPIARSADETGYLVRFTYDNGTQETFECANRAHMIREVKRRQAVLMARGQKATVEMAEIGSEEEAVTTEVGSDAPVTPTESTRGTGGSTRIEPQVERSENNKFILEICQEDGEWVGRITYKNGAGTEEFRADTRKALDMKLLEGKAHATLKVREVLRRDQYHDDLDKVYDIPGYTQDEFDALKPESQTLVIDSIAAKAALAFREETPEFFGSKNNTQLLLTFLHKRNLPVTVKNLKYAFEENADDMEQRPQAKVSIPETSAPAVATVAADSAPTPAAALTVASATPMPAPALTTEVRKRGSFGFKPGFTSSGSPDIVETGGGSKTTEPSEKDARSMPLEELARQVRKGYKTNRQF